MLLLLLLKCRVHAMVAHLLRHLGVAHGCWVIGGGVWWLAGTPELVGLTRCHGKLRFWGGHEHDTSAAGFGSLIAIIRSARSLVEGIERKDRDLGSQVRRSLNSVTLNLSEAFGARAGNARLRFRRSLGELYESQAAFQVAAAWGYISEEQAQALGVEFSKLGARSYGLARH